MPELVKLITIVVNEMATTLRSNMFQLSLIRDLGPLQATPKAIIFNKISIVKIAVLIISRMNSTFEKAESGSSRGLSKAKKILDKIITVMMNISNLLFETIAWIFCLNAFFDEKMNKDLPSRVEVVFIYLDNKSLKFYD